MSPQKGGNLKVDAVHDNDNAAFPSDTERPVGAFNGTRGVNVTQSDQSLS